MSLPNLIQLSPENTIPVHEKWIVYCVAFAAFTFQFEAFLVSIALPDMARELDASSTAISFVVIAYLLAATMAFLPAGRLGDRYGLRRVFLCGAALACVGTLLSGLSLSLPMLWVSRFIQGVGMGVLVAVSYAMVPAWISRKRLGWGYGMLSMGAGVGMIAGLPIGGLLSHYLVWQWIFLATIPLFVVLFVLAYQHLPRHERCESGSSRQSALDSVGLLLFAVFVSALMLTISLGAEFGRTSNFIVSLMLVAIISSSTLIWRARRGKSLLSRELLQCQGFFFALLTLFLFQFVSTGVRFLMPFHLELSFGLSVLMSSAFMLIYPISYAPTGVWAGHLADRIGSRVLVLLALGLGALIFGLYVGFLAQLDIWLFCGFLFVFGIVCALFSPPNNRLMMMSVPEKNRGEASALLPVALNLGGLLGISFFETVFSLHFSKQEGSALQKFALTVETQHTIILGFTHVFLLACFIFFVTFVMVMCANPSQKNVDVPK
jgi:MFS family permease